MNETTNNRLADWLLRVVKGALIGIGGILPGLSGGVLAVIFGVYDRVIQFFSHITQRFFENVRYFLPLGIGFVLGILLFSFVVKEAFGAYEGFFTCLFIGFVVGTFPSLYREAGKEGRTTSDWGVMAVSALGLFILMVYGNQVLGTLTPSFGVWMLSGALIGLGVIVPGLSPSNFLIYLGLYEPMSAGIAALDFSVIIPLALGAVLSVLLLARVAAWLFDRFYAKMYHFILGTVIGSSLAIVPTVIAPNFSTVALAEQELAFLPAFVVASLMFVGGVMFSLWFARFEARVNADR